MVWYYYIGSVVILIQLLFVIQVYKNYQFAMNKYKRERPWFRPKTVLIIPCKGLDLDFEKNITSFYKQDYQEYLLWFVVEDRQDPAYEKLRELKKRLTQSTKAAEIKIWIAGKTQTCSQKIHNLLHCYNKVPQDTEVIAFADSDIEVRTDWLSHLVYPLHQEKTGVASGYRWFIPKKNDLPTLGLSAGNAKVAQLLGNTIFNQAWGGSMAIRLNTFKELGLGKIWLKALSDDLSLSYAVKKAGLKVAFVPACLAPSYEQTGWLKAFEFVRRQFLITKVFIPFTWWFSITSMTFSMLTTWGTLAIAIYAAASNAKYLSFYIAVPVVAFISQMLRAIIRQIMACKLLKEHVPKMKLAVAADIFLFWVWSVMLWALIVSTSFGRVVKWRGISYKMLSPTETVILKD